MVAEMIDRIDALDALLDDLLLFAETPSPRFREVSLDALLEEVVESLSGRFSADFFVHTQAALPTVRGDDNLLRIVFQNLLVNAAQATLGGGTVDITAAVEPPMLTISIAYEGPGFSTEARQALFRPFFTTKARGTGLGLPVARRLVELHGGCLTVDRGYASGARVLVKLPIAALPSGRSARE
jgi:signal transduction histidine kinase